MERYKDFLAEKTRYENGYIDYTHRRLVQARGILQRLLRSGHLFTYLTYPLENPAIDIPPTTNYIEGAVNKSLRKIYSMHCGMALTHRVKAAFWWLYMHSEEPTEPKELLKTFLKDDEVEACFSKLTVEQLLVGSPVRFGDGLVWEELHQRDIYMPFYEE